MERGKHLFEMQAGRQRQLKARTVFLRKKLRLTKYGGLTVQTLAFSVVSFYTNSIIHFS